MGEHTEANFKQVIHLGAENSIASIFMKELRGVQTQINREQFRRNVYRLGQIAAYEISKTVNYKSIKLTTPLAEATGVEMVDQPVIATILRAGLPLYQGMLSFFDKADSAFISAYRKHDQYDGFEIKMNSISCPNITNRTVIICDAMLATGQSLVKTIQEIQTLGSPFQVIICTVISSEEGIDFLTKQYPKMPIYTFAIDPELNAKSYIVPGLGDAGDLCFGPKIQE